jgi:hypothetical protein
MTSTLGATSREKEEEGGRRRKKEEEGGRRKKGGEHTKVRACCFLFSSSLSSIAITSTSWVHNIFVIEFSERESWVPNLAVPTPPPSPDPSFSSPFPSAVVFGRAGVLGLSSWLAVSVFLTDRRTS